MQIRRLNPITQGILFMLYDLYGKAKAKYVTIKCDKKKISTY